MQDRRTEERRNVNLAAQVKLMNVINGPAQIMDISAGGLRLKSNYLFARMKCAELGALIGDTLKISIPGENLSIEGCLMRVAPDCMGMKIHSASNPILWQNLCENSGS